MAGRTASIGEGPTASIEEGFGSVGSVIWKAHSCKSICLVEMQEEVSPFPRSCVVLLVASRWGQGRHLLRNCRLLLKSVSLVEPSAEPRVQ